MTDKTVRAAGGIVLRAGAGGRREVVVVHRPRYDDWTLPKGKLNSGETDEQAAAREVEEETGLRAELGPVAGRIRYRDRHDRPKAVTYFFMTAEDGEFKPNDEVDELRWVSLEDVADLLTYEPDRELVARLLATPPPL